MWHSSPSPKYSTTSAGHWLASASSTRSGYLESTSARTRLRASWVSGRFSPLVLALMQVGHGVEPEAVHPEVEPEAQHFEHRLLDLGIVVVRIRLVGEEAVPEVRARLVVHVQFEVSVSVKMIRASSYQCTVSDHTYQSRFGLSRVRRDSGLPRVVARGVVHHEVGDHADAALVQASMKSRTSSTVP